MKQPSLFSFFFEWPTETVVLQPRKPQLFFFSLETHPKNQAIPPFLDSLMANPGKQMNSLFCSLLAFGRHSKWTSFLLFPFYRQKKTLEPFFARLYKANLEGSNNAGVHVLVELTAIGAWLGAVGCIHAGLLGAEFVHQFGADHK